MIKRRVKIWAKVILLQPEELREGEEKRMETRVEKVSLCTEIEHAFRSRFNGMFRLEHRESR